MIYIGIDPGLAGAVGIIEGGIERVHDTPTFVVHGTKNVRELSAPEMAHILRFAEDPGTPRYAAIELVHSMPEQGIASAFNFGKGFGIWIGLLAAFRIPYDLVTPQRWKKVMLDGMGKEKDAARFRAQQLFPSLSNDLKLKKHHGRAEALLLAEYRRRLG